MKIREYLWDKKMLIFLFVASTIFTGSIIVLSENRSLFESNGFYAILVTLFLFIIYLTADYLKLNFHCRKLKKLSGNNETDWIVSVPSPHTFDQKLYTELLIKLKRNSDEKFEEFSDKNAQDIDFLKTWIHEIKTPIAASKLIIENNLNTPTEKTLYNILDEIEKIEDMVQKTLCYSQLNDFSRDCQIGKVSVQKVVNACIEREYSNIINKGIQLTIKSINFEVDSDIKWLHFIIKQLIDNAIKYSRINGTLQVESKSEQNGQILIIRDFGVGIKEEDLRRVFEKGFTGFNGRKSKASTGVGLYLSQKLAGKLGHSITISSQLGEGTEVSLHFPKYRDSYDFKNTD
ncbi:MAG: sensor histidine kinase [Cellulosilyticaceae bacterium]